MYNPGKQLPSLQTLSASKKTSLISKQEWQKPDTITFGIYSGFTIKCALRINNCVDLQHLFDTAPQLIILHVAQQNKWVMVKGSKEALVVDRILQWYTTATVCA